MDAALTVIAIEAALRRLKHYDVPERVSTLRAALEAAVDGSYTRFQQQPLAR